MQRSAGNVHIYRDLNTAGQRYMYTERWYNQSTTTHEDVRLTILKHVIDLHNGMILYVFDILTLSYIIILTLYEY